MPKSEEILEKVQPLSNGIAKLLKELNPNFNDTIEQMMGIAIFMFPKGHGENGAVRCTMIGMVCDECLVKTIMKIRAEREQERMPIA
jgi:hypothetical protein